MKTSRRIFIGIELLIYISFLFIDISECFSISTSIELKFLSIVICFLFSIIYSTTFRKKQFHMNVILLFILISDYFILIQDSYVHGMVTFLIAQMLIALWIIRQESTKNHIIFVWMRNILIGCLFLMIFYIAPIDLDVLLVISTFYFISFIFNVIDSFRLYRRDREKQYLCFFLGLLLFILCDINVGIFNLSSYLEFDSAILKLCYQISTIAMWFFYLPGIVFITLSISYGKNQK